MKRTTLAMMNGAEARMHYDALVRRRWNRAMDHWIHARGAPKEIRAVALKEAQAKIDKARAWQQPCGWHIKAAQERCEKYGSAAGAAFLAAHGWSAESAHWIIFGR